LCEILINSVFRYLWPKVKLCTWHWLSSIKHELWVSKWVGRRQPIHWSDQLARPYVWLQSSWKLRWMLLLF